MYAHARVYTHTHSSKINEVRITPKEKRPRMGSWKDKPQRRAKSFAECHQQKEGRLDFY